MHSGIMKLPIPGISGGEKCMLQLRINPRAFHLDAQLHAEAASTRAG